MEPKVVTEIPGPRSRQLLAEREKYVARGPFNTASVFVARARGALVEDVDGNVFIDFASGIGTVNAGHSPEAVVSAVKQQAEKFIHPCFHVAMYEPYVRLAETLARVTPGDYPKKVMLANSGAEAVENAVKIARKYTRRTGIVSLECAFHGRTLMAMTLTSKVKPYKYGFGPFAPEVYKVPSAYCYRCSYGGTYPDCDVECGRRLERFFVSECAAENVAAVIVEPVQGEGGFIVQPPEFLRRVSDLCRRHGILFVADEIQTGFARTGYLFASEHYGLEPDLLTLAKSLASGMPLSAVVGRAEIMDAPAPGEIGGTFGGNPVACVAALETLELITGQGLARRARAIGETMMRRLREMQERYPVVGDVRGLGAMVAIELVKDRGTKEPAPEATKRLIQGCVARGVLCLSAGIYSNVARFLVPLVITDEQLQSGLDIIEAALAEV